MTVQQQADLDSLFTRNLLELQIQTISLKVLQIFGTRMLELEHFSHR